jgi:hypothetical protein
MHISANLMVEFCYEVHCILNNVCTNQHVCTKMLSKEITNKKNLKFYNMKALTIQTHFLKRKIEGMDIN